MLSSKAPKKFPPKNVDKSRESSLWKCHVRKLFPVVEIAIIYPDSGRTERDESNPREAQKAREAGGDRELMAAHTQGLSCV